MNKKLWVCIYLIEGMFTYRPMYHKKKTCLYLCILSFSTFLPGTFLWPNYTIYGTNLKKAALCDPFSSWVLMPLSWPSTICNRPQPDVLMSCGFIIHPYSISQSLLGTSIFIKHCIGNKYEGRCYAQSSLLVYPCIIVSSQLPCD